MSKTIEEYANGQPTDPRSFSLDDALAAARPLVIRGLCQHWPAVQQAQHALTDFAQMLASMDNGNPVDVLHMAPEMEGVVGYNDSIDGFNYSHFKVSVTKVLARLATYSRLQEASPGLAMQSAPIADCLPGFLHTHPMPLLPETVKPRLWIGNRVTTPAHFDAFHNLAIAVCGKRRFTLFPIEQVGNLYVGPLDFAPTGAAITMARPERPDFERFPRLREALKHSMVAELGPGDAMYIPPLWWHQVESLEPLNALVNYWWSPALPDGHPPPSGMDALLYTRLAFGHLPAAEKRAWQTLFEHFVFGDEDPAAHIPEASRGVLGVLDAQALVKLRERIRSGV